MMTVVMYHYVRDPNKSLYPRIRGLTPEAFAWQVDYLRRHYSVISPEQLRAHLCRQQALPERSCLLTFDDGLRDHLETVVPVLQARGLTACFFPPAKSVLTHHVLDVHKIHFILAAVPDIETVLTALKQAVDDLEGESGVPPLARLEADFQSANRLNSPAERFIKYVLQKGLPRRWRNTLCSRFFQRYVTADEASFAADLYLSVSELRDLQAVGMEVGGHGYMHDWLGTLPRDEQQAEVEATLAFLHTIWRRPVRQWMMSYPSGSFDATTLALLRRRGCIAGFTSVAKLADLRQPLTLDRLDTIDLPRQPTQPSEPLMAVSG